MKYYLKYGYFLMVKLDGIEKANRNARAYFITLEIEKLEKELGDLRNKKKTIKKFKK